MNTFLRLYRVPKQIKLNKKSALYMKSFGYDTETFQGKPMTFQVWGSKIKEVIFVHSPLDMERKFIEFIERKIFVHGSERNTVFFVFNLEFDLCITFYRYLDEFKKSEFDFQISNGWRLKGFLGSPSYAKLISDCYTLEFIDVACFFRWKLNNLAKTLGIKLKEKLPKDLGKKKFKKSNKKFIQYALNDARIVYEIGQIILKFCDEYDVRLPISISQLAERIFRHQFMDKEMMGCPYPVLWPSLRSYHGGKNGMYVRRGVYKVNVYDIVSAYPYAMTCLPSFYNGSFYQVKKFEDGYCGIYNVTGMLEKCKYPIFFNSIFKPLSGSIRNQWVTSFELKEALQQKEFKPKKVQGFIWVEENEDESKNPFKKYVTEFIRLKNETDKEHPYYLFYKTLLNSLYGKFIQRTEVKNEDGEKLSLCGSMFNPFIASLITGKVRAMIHHFEHRFKSIHTATDSIMTIKPISAINLSNDLGSLKFEAEGTVLLLRNKLYLFVQDGKIKKYALHGFRGKPEQLLKLYLKYGDVKEMNYVYEKMNKLKESMVQSIKPFVFEKKKARLLLP